MSLTLLGTSDPTHGVWKLRAFKLVASWESLFSHYCLVQVQQANQNPDQVLIFHHGRFFFFFSSWEMGEAYLYSTCIIKTEVIPALKSSVFKTFPVNMSTRHRCACSLKMSKAFEGLLTSKLRPRAAQLRASLSCFRQKGTTTAGAEGVDWGWTGKMSWLGKLCKNGIKSKTQTRLGCHPTPAAFFPGGFMCMVSGISVQEKKNLIHVHCLYRLPHVSSSVTRLSWEVGSPRPCCARNTRHLADIH